MLENDSLCKYIPNLYIWFFSCKNSFQCFLLFFLLVRMQNICQTGGLRLTHGEPSWSQHASMNVKNKESWCETELRIIRPDPDCVGPEQTQTEREHPPWQQHDAPLIHWAMFEIFVSKYHRAEQAAHSDVCDPLNTFLNRSYSSFTHFKLNILWLSLSGVNTCPCIQLDSSFGLFPWLRIHFAPLFVCKTLFWCIYSGL